MKQYKALSDSEIEFYREQLILPRIDYPHYSPLIIDGVNVQEYMDTAPLSGEVFYKYGISDNLYVSNYGRISYNNEIVKLRIWGNLLSNTCFFLNGIGDCAIDRLVKGTFDPIGNMDELEVHHINNNGFDNRPQNLLWVTQEDWSRIVEEGGFSIKYLECRRVIRNNAKSKLTELFKNNPDKVFTGFEIYLLSKNISGYDIRCAVVELEQAGIIEKASDNKWSFCKRKYTLKQPGVYQRNCPRPWGLNPPSPPHATEVLYATVPEIC